VVTHNLQLAHMMNRMVTIRDGMIVPVSRKGIV
jgi:ABC-type lipoprotein export system ATPase subunit